MVCRHTRVSVGHTRVSAGHTQTSVRHTRSDVRHTWVSVRHTWAGVRVLQATCQYDGGIAIASVGTPSWCAVSCNPWREARDSHEPFERQEVTSLSRVERQQVTSPAREKKTRPSSSISLLGGEFPWNFPAESTLLVNGPKHQSPSQGYLAHQKHPSP